MSLETAKLLTKTHQLTTTKYATLTTPPFFNSPLWPILSSTPIRPLQCLGVRVIPSYACLRTWLIMYVHIDVSVRTSLCAYILMSACMPRYVLISWWLHAYLIMCVYLDRYLHTSLCEYTLMSAYIPCYVPISWCLCIYLVKCVNFDVYILASLCAYILMSAYTPRYLCIFWYLHV